MSTGHRHTPPGEHEHEFEAEHGLPEPLPAGERILWQGGPDWRSLAAQSFHVRKLVVYFAVILLLRGAFVLSDGGAALDALSAVAWLAPVAVLALAILLVLAWLSARTTVYTITDRRIVMRIGIVLSLTFNLPLKRIAAAGLSLGSHGNGSLPLTLGASDKIAYVHLWPHARPWRLSRPEPMLVCVPDAAAVAKILSTAWSAATGLAVQPTVAEDAAPQREPRHAAALAGH